MNISIPRLMVIFTLLTIGPAVTAQALTWSGQVSDGVANIGAGATQRPSVSSVEFNGKIYLAYTTECGNIDCPIQISSTSQQLSNGSFYFAPVTEVSTPLTGEATTDALPALTVDNGIAYVAWIGANGISYLSSSTNMQTWSNPIELNTGATTESVTLTVNPMDNELWLGYLDGASGTNPYYPTICYVSPDTSDFSSSQSSCYSTTDVSYMVFNPTLLWDQYTLYLFQEYRGSSHCVSEFENFNGGYNGDWNYEGNDLCHQEQTSGAPSAVLYGGEIYLAFRSNDSSQSFDLETIDPGTNTPTRVTSANLGQQMSGNPDLQVLSATNGLVLNHPSELINFYVQTNTLYSNYGY